MLEGISSQKQVSDVSAQNSPWDTSPTIFPSSSDSSSNFPTPAQSNPGVYSSHNPQLVKESLGSSGSGFSIKKMIKMGIGMFVILTVIFVTIAIILPHIIKPSTKDVTLTYWGLWEEENVMRPVISEFEKENPHIKIDYKKQDPNDYRERLTVRTQNGTGPDIFRFHNTWYPMLKGVLLPLPKETIEKDEFEDNYYDVAKSDLIKNGTIYAVPLETDTLSLYINTQLFDQESAATGTTVSTPKTWQEFIDASTRLTKREADGTITQSGAAIGTFENVNHASDIISLLFAQNGADINNISNSKEKIEDAIKFYTNFALVEDNVWDATQDNSLLAFSQGKLAMYFGYSWDYFSIKAHNPNIQMKVVPVPQLISDEKINLASYWAEGVSRKSKHPKESFLFMKFLAKPETQEKLFAEASKTRAFGEPYSNKNLAEKLNNTDAFVFVDQSKTAISTPFIDGTGDNGLNSKLNTYLKDLVNVKLSDSSDESSVDTFLQGYSQVISSYNGTAK